MEFSNWYSKSIEEAQERYKKEDEEKQTKIKAIKESEDLENQCYDMNYGSIPMPDDIEEDLLRLDDDGGWHGI